jgi:hypothetical protein
LVCIIGLFFSFNSLNGQVPVHSFNEKEQRHFQTIVDLVSYLKSKKTFPIPFHDAAVYNDDEGFYDSVIDSFFVKEKMLKMFEKDSSFFTPEGKMNLVRHILNSCDLHLDTLAEKSILIEPYRYSIDATGSESEAHWLNVFLEIKNKKVNVLVCHFDGHTSKLLGFSVLGAPAPGSH